MGFNQLEDIAQTLFLAQGKPLVFVAVADGASVLPVSDVLSPDSSPSLSPSVWGSGLAPVKLGRNTLEPHLQHTNKCTHTHAYTHTYTHTHTPTDAPMNVL